MDHHTFDQLTRLLATTSSRRRTLGALLSTAILAVPGAEVAAKRRPGRITAQTHTSCQNPGPGKNLSNCDFTQADLRGKSLRGANLSKANFTGAELCGVDLRGANLGKTDFTGAHLTRADLRGTNLSTAILTDARFCQTRKPNGTLDRTHCPPRGSAVCCGDDECDGLCQRGVCLERGCRNVAQTCDYTFGPACCEGGCNPEIDFFTYSCQLPCASDQDCAHLGDFNCIADVSHCPRFAKCCRAKNCTQNADCASGKCCNFVCCRGDQRCGVVPFELSCADL